MPADIVLNAYGCPSGWYCSGGAGIIRAGFRVSTSVSGSDPVNPSAFLLVED